MSHHLLKSCISLRKSENVTDPVTDYDVVVFNASIFLCVMAVFMVKDIEKMMNWSSLNVTIPDLTDIYVQFSSVAQSCPTLCDPMNCSMPGLPVHHQLPEFTKLMCIKSVMPSSHLILCRPLLLLPPIPPSIRVFSNESTLLMRWPKYWSFSFSISPSSEHPGLISFRVD